MQRGRHHLQRQREPLPDRRGARATRRHHGAVVLAHEGTQAGGLIDGQFGKVRLHRAQAVAALRPRERDQLGRVVRLIERKALRLKPAPIVLVGR